MTADEWIQDDIPPCDQCGAHDGETCECPTDDDLSHDPDDQTQGDPE